MENENVPVEEDTRLRIIDRQMPLANIAYIMKDAMPESAKISKEAKETMGKCASEFIAIVSCRAKDICDSEARKTITGEDLIRAMEDLDLPYYSDLTKILLVKFKETMNGETRGMKYQPDDNISFHSFTE